MAWYSYANRVAFDPNTLDIAPVGSVGQVYAVTDSTFSNPIQTFDLTGIPIELVAGEHGFLPTFQVEDHVELKWVSGEYVFHLNTTTPLFGPAGPSVASAAVEGDSLTFNLNDGTTLPPVILPTGPGGSDEGVAGYIASPDSATSTALEGVISESLPVVMAPEPAGSDDTTSLNATLASNNGKAITLKAGRTYRITDALNIPSGTTLDGNGATIDATGIPAGVSMSQRKVIQGAGSIGPSIKISGAIAKGARVIAGIADTSGFAAGDLVRVRNLQVSPPGSNHVSWTKGELNTVASVDSASQITLDATTLLDYADDGNLVIAKVDPLENVTIKNLKVRAGGKDSTHTGIMLTYARNLTIDNVAVIGGEDNGIYLSHVYRGTVNGCTIDGSTSPPPSVTNTGYGLVLMDASRYVTVSNNRFNNCRSFVNGGGTFPVAHVLVTGNYGANCTATAYSSHEPCFHWTYTNNTAIGGNGSGTGIQWRGQHAIIKGNRIIGMPSHGIRVYAEEKTTSQADTLIEGNQITSCGAGIVVDGSIITSSGAESTKYNTVIAGNQINGSTFDGILVRHFDKLTITGNQVEGSGSSGINLLGLSAANPSTHAMLSNNTVVNSAVCGIKAQYVTRITIAGGMVKNSTDRGILLDACFRTATTGVLIDRANINGIRVVGGGQHTLNGNNVQETYGATADAVAIVNTVDVSITGGMVAASRYGVNVAGTDKIAIVGVHALGAVQSTKILLDAAAVTRVLSGNLGTSSPAA